MKYLRTGTIVVAALLLGALVAIRTTQAQETPDRYFVVALIEAVPGSLNPRPVEADSYAVYGGVLEFATTSPDGVRRIVFGAPLSNVKSYYEYGYPGY
jgi:hypothetical protein